MASSSYVRSAMLPPSEPPQSQRGLLHWVRDNLFSGWLNSALTILGVLSVLLLVKAALPWLLNSVWVASSLGECREIITTRAGEGATGACWAVIRERWHQFIYGFYPREIWWRPTFAFGLMFVALAPVLYYNHRKFGTLLVGIVAALTVAWLMAIGIDGLHLALTAVVMAGLTALAWFAPRHLVWVTVVYPATAFWLLWGGSVWGPVMTMLGFGIFVGLYTLLNPRLGVVVSTGLSFVLTCLWWLWLQTYVSTFVAGLLPWGMAPVNSDQFGGFLLAFVIGVTSISVSLPIGILLALGRRSDMFLIRIISVGFIEFVRGVPLITMLFTASLLLQYFLPPQVKFDLILRVIILVTLFASAYIAEVIRGGLAALPRGQYEAADALGLDYWQAQRLIIMPQALKISIPGIVSTFIGLFKDTTLVAFVGLMDPLKGVTAIVRADINWKGIYWEPYIFVGVLFFLICFGMSRYSMYLERKLKTDHR